MSDEIVLGPETWRFTVTLKQKEPAEGWNLDELSNRVGQPCAADLFEDGNARTFFLRSFQVCDDGALLVELDFHDMSGFLEESAQNDGDGQGDEQ